MTIKDLVAGFQKEKQKAISSRFPCRAIMVKNVKEYCCLLSELKKISDIRIVKTAEMFSNADVMPNFENLKSPTYQNEWVILTGISEYLRLFSKKEITDRRFANLWSYQVPASSTGRIIIPLWGCEAQWFDSALNLNSDLRQQDFYFDCSEQDAPEQTMNLLVLSGVFEQYISKLDAIQGELKIGLQEWFDYWANPSSENHNFVLVTKRCGSINTTNGNVTIHVIRDALSFIREYMKGADILTDTNCNDEMKSELFDFALKGKSLDESLLSILNVSTFFSLDVMGKWESMSISHKRFVALWFSIHPDNSYISHCFARSNSVAEVTDTILLEIFKVRLDKPEWIDEFRRLTSVMALTPDDRFFSELDLIPAYETRLEFMNGSSQKERVYLLRMVGKWMRTDYFQVASCAKLEHIYPELFYYLNSDVYNTDEDIVEYMSRYKAHKLENTLPADEDIFFGGIQTDKYDNRYSVLADNLDNETFVLWIDALGVEWLPLLHWAVSHNCDGTINQVAVTQANLPTETCFNELWKEMNIPYNKLGKLDKLAHKGVIDEPDYYACIEEQLAFVAGIHRTVSDLLKKHRRVIITGDHGTSRLAARFFHTKDGIDVPKNATVCSHGRYCKLGQVLSYDIPNTRVVKRTDGTLYAVYTSYDHFKQSGFAAGADDENAIYGEVHGGATPEELLVPVIVINGNNENLLTAEWEKSTVKISMKKAQLTLIFSKPVQQLKAKVADIDGITSPVGDGYRWNVVFSGITQGTHVVQVYANNRIVDLPSITIQSAISGEGDLP